MSNFIANFMTYAQGCEAPQAYTTWAAVSTLASLVSRRVYINQGYFTIYPNLYIVLVGMPGDRKTTAMVMSSDILNAVNDVARQQNRPVAIPMSADCMTKEAVCKYMAANCIREFVPTGATKPKQYTPLTLCLTELTHFLGTGNSAHMIDFLVTIFDREVYETKTKNKGDDIIPGPFLNILACTTPAAITRYLKEDVISGGFSRRALFVYEMEPGEPVSWPEISDMSKLAIKECLEWAEKIQQVQGEFKVDEKFKKWYDQWYRDLFAENRKPQETMTRGYFRSKHIQAFKIAMLIALAESTDLILTIDHFQVATEMLDRLEKNLPKVYEGMGRNELNAVAAKVMQLIDMAGQPIPEKKILSEMFRDADTRELYGIIEHLKRVGKVVALDEKDSSGNVIRRCLATPQVAQAVALQPAGPTSTVPPRS